MSRIALPLKARRATYHFRERVEPGDTTIDVTRKEGSDVGVGVERFGNRPKVVLERVDNGRGKLVLGVSSLAGDLVGSVGLELKPEVGAGLGRSVNPERR